MSKVLVICARRYNGHELWTLLGTLQKRGHTFEVVSTALQIKDELTFQPNVLERTVYNVPATTETTDTFDAICVVSGNMADTEAYWTDKHVHDLLGAFRAVGKPLAAICCSVPTLAPFVEGIKVSFFPLVRSRQRLQNHHAILQTVSLSVDQNTATAENQMLTQMWGDEICNLLEEKPPTHVLTDSKFVPKGRERRMPPDVRKAIDEAKERRKNSPPESPPPNDNLPS